MIWYKEVFYDWGGSYKSKLALFRSAEEHFRQALELDPVNPLVLTGMSLNYAKTGKYGGELDAGLKRAVALVGRKLLLFPPLTTACTYLFLDKLTLLLWGLLAAFIPAYILAMKPLVKERILMTGTTVWLIIVFINYYPKLFIPFGWLFIVTH